MELKTLAPPTNTIGTGAINKVMASASQETAAGSRPSEKVKDNFRGSLSLPEQASASSDFSLCFLKFELVKFLPKTSMTSP